MVLPEVVAGVLEVHQVFPTVLQVVVVVAEVPQVLLPVLHDATVVVADI